MLRRLRFSVDYYNISIDDAIGAQTLDTAQRFCFDPVFNPIIENDAAAAAATAACQAVNRTAGTGALGNVLVTYMNSGRIRTQGIETQLDWAVPIGPGEFTLNNLFSYLITYKSAPLPQEAGAAGNLVEYAGTLGPAGSNGVGENGLNPGAFRWKMLTSFGYSLGPATVGLQWQHLPSAKSVNYPSNNATPFIGAPSYDLFNLNMSYALTDNLTLRAGVENLFDKAPPLTEYNPNSPSGLYNSVGSFPINSSLYDVVGRRFFAGASAKF